MEKRILYVSLTISLCIILFSVFLYFQAGDLVASVYNRTASQWLLHLTDLLYPRFIVEKFRFPQEFFVSKIHQISIRILLMMAVSLTIIVNLIYSKSFPERLKSFTEAETNIYHINALRVLFYLLLIISCRNVYEDLKALYPLKEFYKPISILKIFNLPFPAKRAAFAIYGLIFFSATMVVFGIKPRIFSVTAVIGFIIYQSYLYSFEKIDHGYGPFTYVLMLFPFLLCERDLAKKNKAEVFSSWSFRLILLVICLVYFLSGLEKLLTSGLDWLSPDTFRAYLLMHNTEIGHRISQSGFLCTILPLAALILQLGFPLILLYPKLKWIILPAGVLFHWGTVVLFGISSFENPWLFNYIFFFDWTRAGRYLASLPSFFRS